MTSPTTAAPEVPGYRLTTLLGAGASAQVWRARRVVDDGLVAIKVVAGIDPSTVAEWALLQHAASEHVVGLHEVLDVDTVEGPGVAMVLDLLSGGSLGGVIAQRGHLSPGESVTVLCPIAGALARLHELGIVHGDVSPGNVLLDPTGRPVLGDLGVSRIVGDGRRDVHGTEGYVAPEVLLGGEPRRESDVYAVGALAWLSLTGRPPGHVAARGDLAALAPDAPEALRSLVEACLAPDPAHRPLADDLAVGLFDAAPAEPLRLTAPGDVATGLTRRIREAAAEDADLPWHRAAAAEMPTTWWSRRRSRRAARADERREQQQLRAARPPAGRHGQGRERQPAQAVRRPGPTGRWVGALSLAAVAGIGIAVLTPLGEQGLAAQADQPAASASAAPSAATDRAPSGSSPSGDSRPEDSASEQSAPQDPAASAATAPSTSRSSAASPADGASPSSSAPQSTAGPSSPQTTAAPPTESDPGSSRSGQDAVLTRQGAAREDPRSVATALTELRQRAVQGDDAALALLDVPESPAATADAELIAAMKERGESFRGVALTVRSAKVRPGAGEGGEVVLRVQIDEGSFGVASADGQVTPGSAASSSPVDLHLRWHGERWRVYEVRAV